MKQVYNETGYVLDPHGACGYQALIDNKLAPNETGLFLETAHPAKFKGTVDKILDADARKHEGSADGMLLLPD